MIRIDLKNSFVSYVTLKNKPKVPPKPIKIQQKFTYNVKYTHNNICHSELISTISSEDPTELLIQFTTVGIFQYDPSLTKEEIHRETYIALYPFAKAFCVNLTASCGMQPLYIAQIDVNSQEIFRIDLGGIKTNNE